MRHEIHLIRHGETAFNRARVVQVPETPLSDHGIAQAERLAARLADAGIVHVLASDMARARMTAEPLARSTGAPLELTPLLHERNFGDLRGTPYSELQDDIFAAGYEPPAGESWPVFHERVDEAWATVLERAAGLDGPLAVVTHGLVLHSISARLLDLSAVAGEVAEHGPDGPSLGFTNTAVTRIEPPGTGGERWRVTRFACAAHLDELRDGAAV